MSDFNLNEDSSFNEDNDLSKDNISSENSNVSMNEEQLPQEKELVAPSSPSPSKFSKGLVEQLELIVIAFTAIILVFSFFVRTCQVSGSSMDTTLTDGENVLISNLFYEPQRGDIIVFHNTNDEIEGLNEPMVKRVIGLPGDTVKVEYILDMNTESTSATMKVTLIYADGTEKVLEEDYIQYQYSPQKDVNRTYYVEEGTIFVMGDNRTVSLDSRSPDVGLVDSRRVLGKVILRITPFSKFGKVE